MMSATKPCQHAHVQLFDNNTAHTVGQSLHNTLPVVQSPTSPDVTQEKETQQVTAVILHLHTHMHVDSSTHSFD